MEMAFRGLKSFSEAFLELRTIDGSHFGLFGNEHTNLRTVTVKQILPKMMRCGQFYR